MEYYQNIFRRDLPNRHVSAIPAEDMRISAISVYLFPAHFYIAGKNICGQDSTESGSSGGMVPFAYCGKWNCLEERKHQICISGRIMRILDDFGLPHIWV